MKYINDTQWSSIEQRNFGCISCPFFQTFQNEWPSINQERQVRSFNFELNVFPKLASLMQGVNWFVVNILAVDSQRS